MPVLPYGAIDGVDCERVAIILPSSVYEEGEYPEAIVAHHVDGLTATPVRLGIEYFPNYPLRAENTKLREMVVALWKCCAWETGSEGWCEECDHHDTEEGGCRLKSLARELGIEVDK